MDMALDKPAMSAEEFRAIRLKLELTQLELAIILDYHSPVRVSEIERGVVPVQYRVALLMEAFGRGWRPADMNRWPSEHRKDKRA
jgi:transcriptional regulator with XRE-family HTH domain